jgi:hypothetical protein
MNKIIIIALLCIISTLGSIAQEKKFNPHFVVGASFGTTFSGVSFLPKVQNGMLLGYTGGLVGRYDSEKNVGIQVELNFAQQGWEEEFFSADYSYSRVMNYIELPLLTHIYFGNENFKVFFNLGPKVGYALSEKTHTSDNYTPDFDQEYEENHPLVQHDIPIQNKLDWGLCGGPGIELRTKAGYFVLEGRYYYGLGNIFKSKKVDPFPQSSPNVISVKLAYLVSFGK